MSEPTKPLDCWLSRRADGRYMITGGKPDLKGTPPGPANLFPQRGETLKVRYMDDVFIRAVSDIDLERLEFTEVNVQIAAKEQPPEPVVGLPSPNNIERLNAAGWDIPANVWMAHPSAEAIKSSLIAPFKNDGDGICVKRLWLPHMLTSANTDATQLGIVSKTADSMHRRAIAAWKAKDIDKQDWWFDAYMNEAKSSFHSQCDAKIESGKAFTSFVVASIVSRDEATALLALDWIQWKDAEEFESAFAKVYAIIEKNIDRYKASGTHWGQRLRDGMEPIKGDGYWHSSPHSTTADYLKGLLALAVYGVNPNGESHRWATAAIDKMGADPTSDPDAIYSPFDDHNCANLISLGNGGGREWGAHDSVTSFGGYELNFAWSFCFLSRAVDTATGGKFGMVENNLYIQSRHEGLTAIEDLYVEITGFHPTCAGAVEVWSRLLNGTNAGGIYSWLTNRSPLHKNASSLRVFQALAGPKSDPISPSGSIEKRIGSRFYYVEDSSKPDSTFRVMNHHRSLDAHREMGDERIMRFAIGNVGLVEGHCNRSAPSGALANGIFVGEKHTSGDPKIADSQWWAKGMTRNIYGQSIKPNTPFALATDERFLVGKQPKPDTTEDLIFWMQDWSEWAGVYIGSTVTSDPRFSSAESYYMIDKLKRSEIIIDQVTVDLNDGLYLGWHFSPSRHPQLTENGFTFTDGIDTISVKIEPLGDFNLVPKVRQSFDLGFSAPLGKEWHETGNGGRLNRIAANVGYTPDTITADNTYRVRVTIQAESGAAFR